MDKKLYVLRSDLKHYYHMGWRYKDAPVTWCMSERKEPVVPYHQGIKGYDPDKRMGGLKAELDEYFTYEEAMKLKNALNEVGEDCSFREITLPIDNGGFPNDFFYDDELTSMNSFEDIFRQSAKLPFKAVCYTAREICTPDPEPNDFEIGCANIKEVDSHECICCQKSVSLSPGYQYRVLANHYRSLAIVCDACAKTKAPHLYSSVDYFNNLSAKTDYMKNLNKNQKHQWAGSIRIIFRKTNDQKILDCPSCGESVMAKHPYQMAFSPKIGSVEPLCSECTKKNVPELKLILDHIDREYILSMTS